MARSRIARTHNDWFTVALAAVGVLAVAGFAGIAVGARSTAGASTPGVAQGELYFTRFAPPAVLRVSYSYRGGRLTFGSPHTITSLVGADGVVFAPDGDLVIGGTARDAGHLEIVDAAQHSVDEVATGIASSFMVAVAPGGRAVYTAGLPGELAALPLDPPGPGHAVALSGPDRSVTGIAFAPDGTVLYTSSPATGQGDIGILDLATGRTTRLFRDVPGAHGVTYDPFSNCFIVIGGETVYQLDAADPRRVVSELTVPDTRLDQGAVTGKGLAFLASNSGRLVFIDYSRTGRIGNLANRIEVLPLITHLDDVAPLSGPGSAPVVVATNRWRRDGIALLLAAAAGLFTLVVGRAAGSVHGRRRVRPERLPRWDLRRNPTGKSGETRRQSWA